MPSGRLSGKPITLTAPACGRISTLLGRKGRWRSRAGPFPGRVRNQNPSEGRGSEQAGGIRADPGSTTRGQHVRRVDDSGSGETLRAWRSPRQAPAGLRRQSVQQPQDSGLSQTAGIRYTIPRKFNERRTGPFNRALYRQLNLVEWTINRLKQFRRIATRYKKKAENYLAMSQIVSLSLSHEVGERCKPSH